jgi:hypothetical protein
MSAAALPGLDVSGQTMLPDLLARHPQARPVLDRYGLAGCGGRLGPVETLGFFARTHGVDERQLLDELAHAIRTGIAPTPVAPSVADTLYRRYFLAGILVILTAGASWGAWLLWKIGLGGSFTGNSIHAVNAHGYAQIFGWVGLFIMGFAYQAFPRVWHTQLAAPRLGVAAFVAMLVSVLLVTLGMTTHGSWSLAMPTALAGGALGALAATTFVAQLLVTFRRSGAAFEPYVGFAVGALIWFVLSSLMGVWHTWTTMSAESRDELLWYVATYQAPLRDLQIHGLALFMILGVSLRMLPPLFDLPRIADRRAWGALAILGVAVLGETVLFIAYRWTSSHVLAASLMVPWLLLVVGVGMIALPWKFWRPLPTYDRSGKFVRAAYGWLAVSLVMLLALPLYQYASGIAFSHAYYGAIRHAITVGFISMMIMGFAGKVVPTLNGIDTRTLTQLWGPFILVNVGCFLRVSLQTLTDFVPDAFKLVGISGTLEVAGLAWWGAGLVAIMRRGKREAEADRIVATRPQAIEADHIVADVLAWFPRTIHVFDRFGFGALHNPLLRRTVGRVTTVAKAAAHHSLKVDELLAALNEAAVEETQPGALVSLTVKGAAR